MQSFEGRGKKLQLAITGARPADQPRPFLLAVVNNMSFGAWCDCALQLRNYQSGRLLSAPRKGGKRTKAALPHRCGVTLAAQTGQFAQTSMVRACRQRQKQERACPIGHEARHSSNLHHPFWLFPMPPLNHHVQDRREHRHHTQSNGTS